MVYCHTVPDQFSSTSKSMSCSTSSPEDPIDYLCFAVTPFAGETAFVNGFWIFYSVLFLLSFLNEKISRMIHSRASIESCLSADTLQLAKISKWAISIFQNYSILWMFTKEVSTSLVKAKLFMFYKISPSFGWCLEETPLAPPFSLFYLLTEPRFSSTPTVNWPNEVISSASDC